MDNGMIEIKYPDGVMMLNVPNFFAIANVAKTKKVIQLIKQDWEHGKEIAGEITDLLNEKLEEAQGKLSFYDLFGSKAKTEQRREELKRKLTGKERKYEGSKVQYERAKAEFEKAKSEFAKAKYDLREFERSEKEDAADKKHLAKEISVIERQLEEFKKIEW